MKNRLFAILAIVAAVVVLVGGVGLCQMGMWPAISPTVTPTPTSIIKRGPLVINAVRAQAKLETVVMNIAGDQDVTRVSGVAGLCTESITYLAYYDVVAGVDLSKITTSSITVTNDGFPELATVTITLPPPEIANVVLDTQHSRLVVQNTPIWIPGCETQVADMTLEAQRTIQGYAERAAIERGILKLAQERASFELERLLMNVGYQNVTILYSEDWD